MLLTECFKFKFGLAFCTKEMEVDALFRRRGWKVLKTDIINVVAIYVLWLWFLCLILQLRIWGCLATINLRCGDIRRNNFTTNFHYCIFPFWKLIIVLKSHFQFDFFVANLHLQLIQIVKVVTEVEDSLVDGDLAIWILAEGQQAMICINDWETALQRLNESLALQKLRMILLNLAMSGWRF